ncbi:hypothetical protein MRX96_018417 [Rhipicephalus microplus]
MRAQNPDRLHLPSLSIRRTKSWAARQLMTSRMQTLKSMTRHCPPQDDVLYDDTLEDFYEEMPTEEMRVAPPLKALVPKMDKEKHDNMCKKFGLPSGWQQLQPVDAGYARSSSTGGGTKNLDLPLQRGEPVYVLRFENNPPGKWLVRNHQGEVGYADLMNIEIMTMHRSPCTSMKKQQTSAMESEDEEAIYEETF